MRVSHRTCDARYQLRLVSRDMQPVKSNNCGEHISWRHTVTVGLAPLVFIAPPIWFGFAEYGLFTVSAFGLVVTSFAFLLGKIDGRRLSLSPHGAKKFAVTYFQIMAVLITLYFAGNAATD